MTHSRPIDRSAPKKPARAKKRKPVKPGPRPSRTAIDQSAPWPFPGFNDQKMPAKVAPAKGLRYIDAAGVERVYSFKRGRQ